MSVTIRETCCVVWLKKHESCESRTEVSKIWPVGQTQPAASFGTANKLKMVLYFEMVEKKKSEDLSDL